LRALKNTIPEKDLPNVGCNTIGDMIDEYGIKPINAEQIIE